MSNAITISGDLTRHTPDGLDSPSRSFIDALNDGSHILIRPIVPGDKGLLKDAFAHLSERSRYLRFMAAMNELSETQLHYLTEIDYVNHMAWVAIDLTAPEEPGIGVARCIRLTTQPDVAEVGFAVVDSHQARGLGTRFMNIMADWATHHGIRTLRGYVLAENTPMLALLRRFPTDQEFEGRGILRVDATLPLRECMSRSATGS